MKYLLSFICLSLMCGLQLAADLFYEYPCCSNRYWVSADYLYWKMRDSPKTVPLVQTVASASISAAPVPSANTTIPVLIGDENIDNGWRSGGRFAIGTLFDDCPLVGVEASYFFLPYSSHHDQISSTGVPELQVPFFNVSDCNNAAITLAGPIRGLGGGSSGSADFRLKNQMQGAEINSFVFLPWGCNLKTGLIVGLRYWNFNEKLAFVAFTDAPPQGLQLTATDKFNVRNNFYGAQIGLSFDYVCNQFYASIKGKVAFGGMYERINIAGNQTGTISGVATNAIGGIFALSSNIGKHRHVRFSVIPEVDLNVGYRIWDCFSVQLGYSFLYVTNMVYATRQMDNNINSSLFPHSVVGLGHQLNEPKPLHKNSHLWAHGLNIGVEFIF